LKVALRRFGLRATHVDELHPAPTMEDSMSAFSDRIRGGKKGFFKVADFESGEKTFTISRLDEEMVIFDKTVDILNFVETGQQLQLNQTTSEWLLDTFGDDPETYPGKHVTLFLGEYEYNKQKKKGIRLKLPNAPASGDGTVPTRARSSDRVSQRRHGRRNPILTLSTTTRVGA
jgi:hypothetical protein